MSAFKAGRGASAKAAQKEKGSTLSSVPVSPPSGPLQPSPSPFPQNATSHDGLDASESAPPQSHSTPQERPVEGAGKRKGDEAQLSVPQKAKEARPSQSPAAKMTPRIGSTPLAALGTESRQTVLEQQLDRVSLEVGQLQTVFKELDGRVSFCIDGINRILKSLEGKTPTHPSPSKEAAPPAKSDASSENPPLVARVLGPELWAETRLLLGLKAPDDQAAQSSPPNGGTDQQKSNNPPAANSASSAPPSDATDAANKGTENTSAPSATPMPPATLPSSTLNGLIPMQEFKIQEEYADAEGLVLNEDGDEGDEGDDSDTDDDLFFKTAAGDEAGVTADLLKKRMYVPVSGSSKKKRGKLPDWATTALKQWLFDHAQRPYPTEDEKTALVTQTGLTLVQINNWFSNARRRILRRQQQKSAAAKPPPPPPPPSMGQPTMTIFPSGFGAGSMMGMPMQVIPSSMLMQGMQPGLNIHNVAHAIAQQQQQAALHQQQARALPNPSPSRPKGQ